MPSDQMICEGVSKGCTRTTCHHYTAHDVDEDCNLPCGLVLLGGIPGSRCVPVPAIPVESEGRRITPEEAVSKMQAYPVQPDSLREKLTTGEADAIEAEMRRLEADPAVTKRELRLYMQSPMPCGHAVGNLLTCPTPPAGCVICNTRRTP